MRLNKWLAEHTRYSRRGADELISQGKVSINGIPATVGQLVQHGDTVLIDGQPVHNTEAKKVVVLLHKPVGYVCSRKGQGAYTVYSLLPLHLHHLDIAGRLDKDSSGLVVLTNDGTLTHSLTHPSQNKIKEYIISLNKPLSEQDEKAIINGVQLDDGVSRLSLHATTKIRDTFVVRMSEGRNRQIRRTFSQLGYTVKTLHRQTVADYHLGNLKQGSFIVL